VGLNGLGSLPSAKVQSRPRSSTCSSDGGGAARAAGRVFAFTTSTVEDTSNDTYVSLDVPLDVPVDAGHHDRRAAAPAPPRRAGRAQALERPLVQLDRGAFQ